ncbi:MAG: hypothetical protein FWE80_00085 [Oscillospiraceae bacterium]|nr:hypothetical protein [Oscillospiraceae bacterium]
MKKILFALLLISIACTLLFSCTDKNVTSSLNSSGENTTQSVSEPTNFDYKNVPNGVLNWDEYDFPFPKPPASRFEMAGGDKTLFCYGMNKSTFDEYKSVLKKDGWQLVCSDTEGREDPDDAVYYSYIKGNQTINIVNQAFFDGDGGNHIRIGYIAGYAAERRSGGISKKDALPLIQAAIDADPDEYEQGKRAAIVVELHIPNAFEKAQMQIFTAYGENTTFGSFIIRRGYILRVFDGFSDVCVADIDHDGEYELISMFGWGSGIYRIQITAYKFKNPPEFSSLTEVVYPAYGNTWVPDGYLALKMVQINDTDIKILGGDYEENGEMKLTDDYGLLKVDGKKLVPANTEHFPIREWN